MGALEGPPQIVADTETIFGEDPYSRQLHAVALRRAMAQLNP